MGLTILLDLGQTVSHAEETLDIVGAASRRESRLSRNPRPPKPNEDLPGKVEEIDRLMG